MKTLIYSSLLALSVMTLSACGTDAKTTKTASAAPIAPATQSDEQVAADDTLTGDAALDAKRKPKPKPAPRNTWRCVAIGINFFDGLKYTGDGLTQAQANNLAVQKCVASGPKRQCAVISSPLPGLFSAGGCFRIK